MIAALAAVMAMFLILIAGVSAPPEDCAPLAYCLAEAQRAFCEAWPNGLPAMATEEERPVHALIEAMEAKGCPVPQGRLDCPAPEPARVAPPVDCNALGAQ